MRCRLCIIFFIAASLFLAPGCRNRQHESAAAPDTPPGQFIIAGSGPCLPITQKLAEGFYREGGNRITIPTSIGSSGGIQAVAEGAIDIGLSSCLLSEREKSAGLKQTPFARVGLIIGVNQDVPDMGITYQDLVDIFQGRKTAWANGRNIVVLSREKGDRTVVVLETVVPGFKRALADSFKNERWQVYYTATDEAEAIINTSNSVGLTDTGAVTAGKLKIKPLRVNGVEPTPENIKNGSYKLYIDLYFVYKEPLSERAKRFLAFVFSDRGQKIISVNGGIPLKGK